MFVNSKLWYWELAHVPLLSLNNSIVRKHGLKTVRQKFRTISRVGHIGIHQKNNSNNYSM